MSTPTYSAAPSLIVVDEGASFTRPLLSAAPFASCRNTAPHSGVRRLAYDLLCNLAGTERHQDWKCKPWCLSRYVNMQTAHHFCLTLLFEVPKRCLGHPRMLLERINKAMYLCRQAVILVASPVSSFSLSFSPSSHCHQSSRVPLQHYQSIASTMPCIPMLFLSMASIKTSSLFGA